MNLEPQALERDEVFLFLVFLYCESKRQDKKVRCRDSSDKYLTLIDVCLASQNASGGWQA